MKRVKLRSYSPPKWSCLPLFNGILKRYFSMANTFWQCIDCSLWEYASSLLQSIHNQQYRQYSVLFLSWSLYKLYMVGINPPDPFCDHTLRPGLPQRGRQLNKWRFTKLSQTQSSYWTMPRCSNYQHWMSTNADKKCTHCGATVCSRKLNFVPSIFFIRSVTIFSYLFWSIRQ